MAQTNEPGRLIAAAAEAALRPLGCRRRGQSRTWIADQSFWVVVIEFQRGRSKGSSYLNVGAMWLWYAKDHLSFDEGYRIDDVGLVSFKTVEQFKPLAVMLAARAAREVQALREQFGRLSDIHHHLVRRTMGKDAVWQDYHAAVAAGLAGDTTISQRLFQRIEQRPAEHQWQVGIRETSAALAALLHDPFRYRSAVRAIVAQCRMRNGLPPDTDCLPEHTPTQGDRG